MATEFLDIKRLSNVYRSNRLNDFCDVEKRPNELQVREQASRCMSCGIPFCHGYGCPLGNAIPEVNAAVSRGDFVSAYNLLSETSPFPEFTSRICPALCESACTAGISSGAITVKQIEFFAIEKAFELGIVKPFIHHKKTGKRIAIIGAGPAGLSAAHFLNGYGHEVAIFEKKDFAGGLLRYGIPNFKLEKDVIERRISLMREAGIIFEFGTDVGTDISGLYLKNKFDAVCLCIGSEVPRDLNIEGRSLNGIYFALDFLQSQNRASSSEIPKTEISAKNKKVLIIGGGDTGSDCLGTALRQGAESAIQIEIMPEPPIERHTSTPWPQWEYKKRTSSSHLEGGKRMWSVLTKSFKGDKSGALKKVIVAKVEWSFDSFGRPIKFREIEGSEFEISADIVLLSMGFTGVASEMLIKEFKLPLNKCGSIECNADFETEFPKVFSCGDATLGASLVVKSIASGKTMAAAVNKYLNSKI